MSRITTIKMLNELRQIAMKDCTCSKDQETGEDPTVCLYCEVVEGLNDIHEKTQYLYKRFIGD